ncbi:ABC transporter permease [Primorskyibacter flagellatus]|uniref:ABC transporter permease n=1 Tax=Primorskyibacter flagellatus TaxID=1387277 RepID=A0A917EAK4_9RHOB|nr:ABC transporter permease [Primorskyibacter flagellatus]GGE15336.1 ABC transporter permease [Primorskyibacter flagellatus]
MSDLTQTPNMTRAGPFRPALTLRLRGHGVAILLVAPLLVFLLLTWVLPVVLMLWRSVDNPEIAGMMPRTAAALAEWDGEGLPDEATMAAAIAEFRAADAERTTGLIGRRLNLVEPGWLGLIRKTGARADRLEPPFAESLPALDQKWADPRIWQEIKRLSSPVTPDYLLATLDRRVGAEGIERVEPVYRVHLDALVRTFLISASVCAACLILGFPLAFLMAAASPRLTMILMGVVLLPFWMSLLARTAAWVVLLQGQGVVNKALISLGLITEPLSLMFNRTGVLIAMTHVMLPYMILPLYAALRTIPIEMVRAGLSLGGTPITVFRRIYLPLAAPGIMAGLVLVGVMSLGYYITPALVGGPGDQMLAWFIAFNTSVALNWGLASALAVLLLVAVGLLYALYRALLRGR